MSHYPLKPGYDKSVEKWVESLEHLPLEHLNKLRRPEVSNGPNHHEAVETLIKRKLDEGESLKTQRITFTSVVEEINAGSTETHVLKRFKSGPKGATELVWVPKSCDTD